jgi:phosphoribosylanthranilate isomerase
VGDLVKEVRPWGVDVSSGVERNGRKDISRIRTFIETVRSAEEDITRATG